MYVECAGNQSLRPIAPQSPIPRPGQIVGVRQRLFLTEEVLSPVDYKESTLIRLSCIDDDAQGRSLEVLWEQELDTRILSEEAWDSIATRGFDPANQFAAYLNTLRWNCVTSTNPRLLQSPFRAGIRRVHPARCPRASGCRLHRSHAATCLPIA